MNEKREEQSKRERNIGVCFSFLAQTMRELFVRFSSLPISKSVVTANVRNAYLTLLFLFKILMDKP